MSITAVVEVKLEIQVEGVWGDDCTVAQVKKQAHEEANKVLNKAFNFGRPSIKIVSKAEIVSLKYKK